jgi:plasmid stabilization system protein ParE
VEKADEIIWSPGARRDMRCLDCHAPHIDELSLDKLREAIVQRVEHLRRFPEMGRHLPRFGPDWRQIIFRPYRIIYFVERSGGKIYVSRIWHASRAEPAEEDLIPLS